MRILIKGGKIVGSKGCYISDLVLEDGKIAEISQNIDSISAEKTIDATSCLIFPGFIDAHTHLDMATAVTTTADNFDSGTKAAILGGTTTIVDFATQDRGMTLQQALDDWHKKADGNSHCNYAFHMAISEWNEKIKEELQLMQKEGITSFKVYMTYPNLMLSDQEIVSLMQEIKKFNGVLCCHCENHGILSYMVDILKKEGKLSPKYHPVSRPAYAEAEAINRYLYMAQLVDIPVMIAHISTKLGLEEVAMARSRGQKVFVETCPQYFTLDESKYNLSGFEGAKYVCSPPLRSKDNLDAIKQAVKNGAVDIISTDHCSFDYSLKEKLGKDDFTMIPNGLPSIQNRAELVFTNLVKTGIIDEVSMMKYLSENPAKIYNMYPQKGQIKVGCDADIVVWDTECKHVITKDKLAHNVDYTPFEGMEATGKAKYVILNGNIAVVEGELVKSFEGKYIKR